MSYRIAAAAAVLAFACASQSGPKITPPTIEIEQEVGPYELNYPVGPIDLRYGFQITNNWSQPITVIRVNLSTSNPAGGAYALRRDYYNVRETIAPGQSRVVTVWAKGYSWGRGPREAEPVSLRAILYFETPVGSYQRVVMTELQQGPA